MVYGYTKTTEYTKFNFRKLHISILTYKKGLPYWWYTGIRRLPKYTKFIYKTKEINFNLQKGASILMVYRYTKTTENTRFNFRKLHVSILTYKKGLPYWRYTGIRRLQSIQNLIFKNFKHQFQLTKRGFHIDGIQVYENCRVYKIYLEN